MKKNVLLKAILAVVAICSFSGIANAQTAVCYDKSESNAIDFWNNHFYYAVCTDYVGTGSKLFSENNSYIDFGGGSSIVFDNIYMSESKEYTMSVSYGIGYADAEGAKMKLYVNDEYLTTITLFKLDQDPPATIDIPVELYSDWNNVIKLEQQKDWPILLGIQLKGGNSTINNANQQPKYNVSVSNSILYVQGLNKADNKVDVYNVKGSLVESKICGESYTKTLAKGLYLLKINGETTKVLVR